MTGNAGGTHRGAGGDWDGGYCPDGASTGEPFKMLPEEPIILKVAGTGEANISLTIFDSTAGVSSFEGSIYLNGGGNQPSFFGDFSLGYFNMEYGPEPSTTVTLISPIYVTVPEGHDYSYTAGNGGAVAGYCEAEGSAYVDFPLWIPGETEVGGVTFPIDKFSLLAPYFGLASTILVVTVATSIYVKHVKRRKEKQ